MRYAFLIYCDEAEEPSPGTKEASDTLRAYFVFTGEVKAKGIHAQCGNRSRRISACVQEVLSTRTRLS